MKKIYFICLAGLASFANAQAPAVVREATATLKRGAQVDYVPASPVIARPNTPAATFYGKNTLPPVKVGTTTFDHQANASTYRRIMNYPGNKISVTWITASDAAGSGFLSRGSGYNHFNGTTWGTVTNQRIEQNMRAGYPNLDFSEVLNKEIIMSHRVDTNGKTQGLIYNTNLGIGSSLWSSTIVLDTPSTTTHSSVLWPRTAISGNYMHVIANYTSTLASSGQTDTVIISGVRQPTVYSRYNFGTSTWEVKNATLPGYDGTRWYNGSSDSYSIDARGSNVAVMMGGLTDDVSMWKSTDNGSTWTNTIIDSFPVPAFNYAPGVMLDTAYSSDGSVNIRLDSTGKAHCFWPRGKVWDKSNLTDQSITLSLGQNAIDYWYEGRPDSIVRGIAHAPDLNNDGAVDPGTVDAVSRYGNASVCTMPAATMDAQGRIFLIYSALTEGDVDGQSHCFRDIYCVYSADLGATWSTPRNLTTANIAGFNTEQMFATVPYFITDKLQTAYMQSNQVGFWNSDGTAGNVLKTGNFDIMYLAVPTADIISGAVGMSEVRNEAFTMDQNYPNPFNNTTTIPVNLLKGGDVTIAVVNVLGQSMFNQQFAGASAGLNKFELDCTNLESGVYFYTVEANGYKVTRQMIVE